MKRATLGLALTTALLGACNLTDPIANSDFDAWCGDVPCGWEKRGEVARVTTWHSHDYAVSFESDDAQLFQDSSADYFGSCFEFSMLAKVDRPGIARIELDFLADGVSEWDKDIPPSDFEPLTFHVKAPTWYDGVRFVVRKRGPGTMILANLGVRQALDASACAGLNPIQLDNLPGGASCEAHEDCAFGECDGGRCVGCNVEEDCGPGQTCGYRELVSFLTGAPATVLRDCVQPGGRTTGAICVSDAECESDVCCEGVCSTCCGEGSCGEGSLCAPSVLSGIADDVVVPHQCDPGMERGELGEACTHDSDCASGECGSRQCTGLCNALAQGFPESCAMLDCEVDQCASLTCAVETVEVGRCE